MNRRTLLTSISVGAATVAGCTGGDENDETGRKYKPCNHMVLEYWILPEDVKAEVDTAFDEGQYESDEELLWQQIAGSDVQALQRGGKVFEKGPDGYEPRQEITFYSPQVDVNDGVHTLQFEETTPQYDSMKHLTVQRGPEVPRNISIAVKNTEGTVIEETDLTIKDRNSEPEVPVASEFGTYVVEVTVEDWGTVTEKLRLHSGVGVMVLGINESDEGESPFSVFIAKDPSDGESLCPWEV
ncbi:hypothetical protein HTG_16420 [Natrinema mahii]|nr:hypothetical protein HTG_16420 [Natrinema mahii]